jgi:uncharacterized protein YndB with AHSA1/START domain
MRTTMVLLLMIMLPPAAGASNRMLTTEFEVRAPIEKAWAAWTTPDGIKTFLARDCKVDLRVDGAYEIYLQPQAPLGERGSEGMRILALEPMRRFAFTWNAPPTIPELRGQRTMVILEFEKKDPQRTLVRFTQLGLGEGASWDKYYEYFNHAWNEVVLPRFRYAMEVGPVNWDKKPNLLPVARTRSRLLPFAHPTEPARWSIQTRPQEQHRAKWHLAQTELREPPQTAHP